MTRPNRNKVVLGVAGLLFLVSTPVADVRADEGAATRPASDIKRPTTEERGGRVTDPYGLDRARLGVLESEAQPAVGGTPRPTASVQRRFDRYVEGVIDADNTFDVIEGRPRLLVLRQPPVRIQNPDDDVARYDVISDREISITGLKEGSTALTIWFADPRDPDRQEVLSYLVRVLPDPERMQRLERGLEDLQDRIATAFPSSIIRLSFIGDSVVIEGQAKDAFEAERILSLVEGTARLFRTLGGSIDVGQGMSDQGQQAGRRVRVINLLVIPGAAQVALKVTVAEVNRAAARSIGLNFSLMNNSGDTIVNSLTGAAVGAATGNILAFLDNGQIRLSITALRNMSLARSLAEPTLVTLNGESASFLAGGEFPVPVVTGATNVGLQGVEYIPFGVSLNFTPMVQDRDRIRLHLTAEVSTRSLAEGTRIGSADIPSLETRTFTTTVEMRSGQTLAIAGLIQQSFGSNGDRVPGLGDLPIFGNLFGFNRTTSAEQELVVIVTPTLVLPMSPDMVPASLPGSDVFEPDDIEFYLLSRLESKHTEDAHASVMTTPDRLGRQRELERKFIVGPAGHADGQ